MVLARHVRQLVVVAVLAADSQAAADYRSTVLTTDSASSYWRLGETSGTTAADENTTNHNTGTYTGSVTLNQGGAIINDSNPSASFSGTNTVYVTVPDSASLKPTSTITMELWGRPTSFGGGWQASVNKSTDFSWADGYGCAMYWDDSNNVPFYKYCCFVNHYDAYKACSPILKNAWTHLVGTYDGSFVRMYKNGALVSSAALSGNIPHTTHALEIARGTDGAWTGRLDEVAIYSTALSAAKVLTHYTTSGRSTSRNDILVDGASQNKPTASSTTMTWENCTGGESNRLLIVGTTNRGTATVSSVTYGGTALTSVGSKTQGSGSTMVRMEMWRLIAPATGCANVVVTFSAALTDANGSATTFSGVHQTTPLGTFASASGTSTAPSVAVTSASRELVVDVLSTTGDASTVTQAASQTEWVFNQNTGTASTNSWGAGSTATGAASVTMSGTLGTSKDWAIGGVSVKFATTPTMVRLKDLTAVRRGQGVAVQWQTGYEVDNLGFHVYREESGQRRRLTGAMLAGSALLAGTVLTAGNSYGFVDDSAGAGQGRYWLEEIDIQGHNVWHGPVSVAATGDPRQPGPVSTVVSALGINDPTMPTPDSVTVEPRASAPRLDPPAQQLQWDLAARPAIKMNVGHAGWYHADRQDLLAAGLDDRVDPRLLQLFVNGSEQTMRVVGQEDGRLDAEDRIEFYGMGLETLSSGTRTYWLTAGAQPGRRLSPVVAPSASFSIVPTGPRTFPIAIERRQRNLYFAALKNGDRDNFFGRTVTHEPLDQALTVHHLDAQGEALLEIGLQGVTQLEHQVTVRLNGSEIGLMAFSEQEPQLTKMPLPAGALREGSNTVTLLSTGADDDVSLVDFVRLSYAHTFRADDDTLTFEAQGGQGVVIAGFTGRDVRVIDVTVPSSVDEIPCEVAAVGPADFAVQLLVPGTGNRHLLAFRETTIKAPVGIRANSPSSWHDTSNRADILIITHRDFRASTDPLVALRRGQGYEVAVVDVEDVFDEENAGEKDTEALQRFLRSTQSWARAPRFVLFVGDSTFDPRNYLGFGDFDFVPTKLLGIGAMESATDDWLADFDGDGVPELAVGRLPVRTKVEADRVVARIVAYEDAVRLNGAAGWKALLVSDMNDGYDFEALNNDIATTVPTGLPASRFFRGRPGAAKQDLVSKIEGGKNFVIYTGHGAVESWAGDLLTRRDVTGALGGSGDNIFIDMTCLNGFFHDLYTESLGESLLKAEHGGALAVWASSNVTAPDDQGPMAKGFFGALSSERTLGETILRAKMASSADDVRRTWILLGDPALTLPVPAPVAVAPTVAATDAGAAIDGGHVAVSSGGCACRAAGTRMPPSPPLPLAFLCWGVIRLRRRRSVDDPAQPLR